MQLITSNISTGAAFQSYVIANVPEGFRPATNESIVALTTIDSRTGYTVAYAEANIGGSISVRSPAQFNGTYLRADWYTA